MILTETFLLNSLLGEANHQERVIRIRINNPEGTTLGSVIKASWFTNRESQGEVFIEQHKSDLLRAESVYGVPAEIIASIIGIETRYGRIKGNIRVIDSLATLAFDYPRRSKFFKTQLEEFLLLSRKKT